MTLKIATWNVNSIRVRLPQVMAWLEEHQPDVLCLQETKVLDVDFPLAAIESMGYSAVFSGQKSYNGVAILSKQRGADVCVQPSHDQDLQKRALALTINDVRVINFYVPNGESVESEKFQYKLNWLARMTEWLALEIKKNKNLIVVGDFNIAPEAQDVYDPKALEGKVLFSVAERRLFQGLIELGLADCFRLHPQPENSYSWWDYRMNAFQRNLGLRIDHILATPALSAACSHCFIDKNPRGAARPSDHAPVVAWFGG